MKSLILIPVIASIFSTLAFQQITKVDHIPACLICGNTKFVKCDQTIYNKFTEDQEDEEVTIKHRYMCNHCLTFTEIDAKKN